jgi:hypothetical protein
MYDWEYPEMPRRRRDKRHHHDGDVCGLGCAFHWNSAEFQRNLAKRHRLEWNVTGKGTGMRYNTILDIPVYSGWYLSTRFLQVENAPNYSNSISNLSCTLPLGLIAFGEGRSVNPFLPKKNHWTLVNIRRIVFCNFS